MKKILVLGATSFAAKVFISTALTKGFQVHGISRSEEPPPVLNPYIHNINIKNYTHQKLHLISDTRQILASIDGFQPNYVVDFAGQGMVAESWKNPVLWFETNVISKLKIFEHLKSLASLEKYIRISTPEVYGSTEYKIIENRIYNPSTPYAISHATTDMSLNALYQTNNFPCIVARFANFYGEFQQLYRIIPKTILSGMTKQQMQMHGDGQSIRSFIHAEDVANGIISLISLGKIGEIYHFSTNEFISIKSLIETILNKLNVNFEDTVTATPDRKSKDLLYAMDSSKAIEELNWHPKISLDQGIEKTIKWCAENLVDLKKISWNYEHKN